MSLLEQDEPEYPEDKNPEVVKAYELFRQNNSTTKLLVLSSIDKTIVDSVKDLALAKHMLEELKELYGKQNRYAHHQLVSLLHSTKLTPGTPVIDHVMKLKILFQELETLGTTHQLEYKTDVILDSLPWDIYGSFIINFNMNKISVELLELGNTL
ncbi:uncharacterized protein LOC122665440 [Telopea speciosissima]|uniref:uncharacterized protein LOC122665440 n=1 Tax=Telopea speciosissima TaxID=54955 RepID=UPI001CC600F3|nr:uncharacterized protein LOC122665440 [Telopea speciosissima]